MARREEVKLASSRSAYSLPVQAKRRHAFRKRGKMLAPIACMVALATAFALMLPAVSMTKEAFEYGSEGRVHTETVESAEGAGSSVDGDDCGSSAASAASHDSDSSASGNGASATNGAKETGSDSESASASSAGDDDLSSAGGTGEVHASGDGEGCQDGDDPMPGGTGDTVDSADAVDVADVEDGDENVPYDQPIVSGADKGAKTFTAKLDADGGAEMLVEVTAPSGAFPDGTTMHVERATAREVIDAAKEQAAFDADIVGADVRAVAVDITFRDKAGEKIEPTCEVAVRLTTKAVGEQSELAVVHVDDGLNAEVIPDDNVQVDSAEEQVAFGASAFSVYALVYTVDFSYGVDGEAFEFTLHGGGDSANLKDLVKALRIVKDDPATLENEIDAFVKGIADVTFSDSKLLYVGKTDADTTSGEIVYENHLEVSFPLGLSQQEVIDINAAQYRAGDWVLIALQPFDTPETLVITMDDGEVFTIDVTDAQDAVMVGDQVQTIANPAGTTIDLFDYWIDNQGTAGRDAWPGLDQSHGWSNDDNNPTLNGTGNNAGINSSSNDAEHGHALKFSPAWAGTVFNGTKNGWTSVNGDGKDGLNSYTGNANPFQGIVQGTLDGGYPKLTDNGTIGSNGESLAYLFDPGQGHGGKASYPGVNQLLYVDRDGYYTYDSRDYAASFNTNERTFTLTEQTSDNTEIRGFWPFGTQNFWSGMHINTQFSMPANGQVLNPLGEYRDMQFEFSGDDDTWLYVDGVLIGDGGGIHNRTEIDVNFAKGTVTVTAKKDSAHAGDFEETKYLDDIFRAAGKYVESEWEDIGDGSGHKRFKAGTYHTFDMFYLERGGGESNLYIHYNLVSTADFTAHKTLHQTEEDEALRRDQFRFELIGFDGKYINGTLRDETAQAIMPMGGAADGTGTVASPSKVHHDGSSGNPGYTSYITGVSEDGNVNFGQADISQADIDACNAGNPPTYRYMAREIVPPDATNAAGVTWAAANDEQRVAGGFVKDNITYDGSVFYFTGTVQREPVTGSDGNTYWKYDLKKTRYTDASYTELDTETKFSNFENYYTPDFGHVEFTKVDAASHPLEGAKFALYKDEACTIPARWIDQEHKPVIEAISGDNGKVGFENVRTGTYYLKEIEAPSGYALDGTVYKVVIEDERDATKQSTIVVNGDPSETAVEEIANAKENELTVRKAWVDQNGSAVGGGNNDVRVKLKRRHWVEDSSASGHTLTVQMSVEDGGVQTGPEITRQFTGDSLILEWDDEWQRNFDWQLTVGNRAYEGWIGEEIVLGDGYTFQQIDNEGRSRRLTISNIDGDVRFTTKYRVNWLHSDANHWNSLNNVFVQDGGPRYVLADDGAFNSNGSPVTLASSNGWAHTWKIGGTDADYAGFDCPAEDGNGREYRYYVVEVDSSGNEIAVGDDVADGVTLVGYSANNVDGVAGQGVVTVTNQLRQTTTSLDIVKVDEDDADHKLGGAVFKLTKKNSAGTYVAYRNDANGPEFFQGADCHFTVPESGLTIAGLTNGDYKLIEVSPPEGYLLTDAEYDFSVVDGAVQGETTQTVDYKAATGSDNARLSVKNKPGKPLPHTGGPGTHALSIVGALMVVAAALLLGRNRRRV